MDNTTGKVNTKITWQGIKISGPLGEKKVKIEGDKVEATPKDSFVQGVLKGAAILLTGPTYPCLALVAKGNECINPNSPTYNKIKDAVTLVGGNQEDVSEAAYKAARIAALKGFAHGIVDFMAIWSCLLASGAVGGPIGAVLGALVGGGTYNLIKDTIRKHIQKDTYHILPAS